MQKKAASVVRQLLIWEHCKNVTYYLNLHGQINHQIMTTYQTTMKISFDFAKGDG
jgi:hypothetical protein